MDNKQSITGQRIDTLLQEKGTQKKVFAIDMQVTPQTVSHWIAGTNRPSDDKIKDIALYFGVDAEYIAGFSDFRTFEDYRNHATNLREIRETAILRFLSCYGYSLQTDNKYDFAYKFTKGDGTTCYIKKADLWQLCADYLLLFDNRLIDNRLINGDFDTLFDDETI